MHGGSGGNRSFLCDIFLSFVSMIVLLRKGEGNMRGRK